MIGEFKGRSALFAERDGLALALLCSAGFSSASVGFVGQSDGLEELRRHGRMTRAITRASRGNVGFLGEVDLSAGGAGFTLALGFGLGSHDAGHHALGGLYRDFEDCKERFARSWRDWQATLLPLDADRGAGGRDLYRASTATLLSHANKSIPGAVASLAIPWGDHRGDDDLHQGAYHLVWPRDLVHHGGGLLAAGAHEHALGLLDYLRATQEPDGNWPQNMWVSGEPFWDDSQVDQAAQPILLADLALREGALKEHRRGEFWPMVRGAAGFVVRNGATTELDRWEEERGYSTFTLATMVAAMLAAADWADAASEPALAEYLRETADSWNACIEGWLYVRGTEIADAAGVDGHYVRILPPDAVEPATPGQPHARLRERKGGGRGPEPQEMLSVDALGLVRFGLREPDDPRIRDTLKLIDGTLRLDAGRGPIWYRYTADRFGEHEDGSPFDRGNKGRGRAWPLLIGERAHYELALGDLRSAERLLRAMEAYAGEAGLIPEQIWDADDIPEKGLYRGRPTGAASPLLWAHAEYLKLRRSLRDGRVFDRPPQAEARYAGGRRVDACAIWRVDHPIRAISPGTRLRIEGTGDVHIEWRVGDGSRQVLPPEPTFLGVRVADVPAESLAAGTTLRFVVVRTDEGGQPRREEYTLHVG